MGDRNRLSEVCLATGLKDKVSPNSVSRYDRAMVTSVLMGDPDFIRCLSCNAGQIHTGGGAFIVYNQDHEFDADAFYQMITLS